MLLRVWRCSAGLAGRCYSSEQLPVVRLSRRTQLWLEKQAERRQAGAVVAPKVGKLLISARRRELNQAAAETSGQWEQPPLASRGWKHRESRGDYFSIVRQREHRAWPETDATFGALGLDDRVVAAVEALDIRTPTWVQKAAIPKLLQGKNVLCASETGSGKSLVYLMAMLHKMLAQERLPAPDSPRGLVLVPSRELAVQVAWVARRLASKMDITVHQVGGGRGQRAIRKQLERPSVDILVATPGILSKALKWDKISLGHLCYVVLDEADTLFDQTFCTLVEEILQHTRIASQAQEAQGSEGKAQLVVIGATFPKGVGEMLSKMMDLGSIYTIKSKKLHHIMAHVQQTFLRLKESDKISELLTLLKKHAAEKEGSGLLVFCNTSSTANWLGYMLDDNNIKHSRLHGQMPADKRLGIFESFQRGRTDVLVCTDIASRGLDSRRVDTVINYDFPRSVEDYLHRVGRVGRVGSEHQGSVVSFISHPWDVELVQKIETAARKRSCLPGLESSIKHPTTTDSLIKENEDES